MTTTLHIEGSAKPATLARIHAYRQAVVDRAVVYQALGDREGERALALAYYRMADAERAKGAFWAFRLMEAGVHDPTPSPSRRGHVACWLAKRFGAGFLRPAHAADLTA